MYLPAWFLLNSLGYRTVYSFYLLRSVVLISKDGSTVRYASIFSKKYGALVRFACFVMVGVRYASKIELKNVMHAR